MAFVLGVLEREVTNGSVALQGGKSWNLTFLSPMTTATQSSTLGESLKLTYQVEVLTDSWRTLITIREAESWPS